VILFTTGSEKEPKAVRLSHKNIISNINDLKLLFNLTEKDTMLSILPVFHIFGLTINTCLPFYIGMSSVVYANPLDFKTVVSIIKENSPSIMAATPYFLTGYLRKSETGDFQSLKYIVSGGDKCHEHLHLEFIEKHKKRIYEGYGTTETSPVISANTDKNYRFGSVGKPLPGVKVKIVHHETGLPLKPRESGKIMVSGDTVMKGYFGEPISTKKCMVDDFYNTGDMGYLDEDGFLWHVGRLKRFIKIASEMVSLESVENALEKCVSENTEFCVVGIENRVKGVKLVAAISAPVDEVAVCKKMKEHLPNLCIPKEFIIVEELPRLFNGKIDFKRVEEIVCSLYSAK
jgi:acyl-[acyl-carrier-protein]-phospholipid O-acyltransferase/long-chain-fatty-acid--[acyl-carrier-protein] ligase